MQSLGAMLKRLLRRPSNKIIRVAGAAPLAAGVMVYAIDIDGRRIIVGASPHAICVLDRYRPSNDPGDGNPEGAKALGA